MAEQTIPRGGYLAKNAALLCQNSQFRLYLDRRRAAKFDLEIPDGTHTEDDAREFILMACRIESRAELDHNPEAATIYRRIMHHYRRWQDRQSRQVPRSQ